MARKNHLAKAKDYIAKGEDYYRKAAAEIVAEREENDTPWSAIADEVGRSTKWCRDLVHWHTSGDSSPTPFARSTKTEGQDPDRATARTVARTKPETITADPEARKAIEAQLAKESKERYEKMRKRQDEREKKDPSMDRLKRLGHVLDVEVALGKAENMIADALEFHYLPHPEEFSDADAEEFAADLQDIIDVASGFKTIITTGDLSLSDEVLGFVRKPKEEVG